MFRLTINDEKTNKDSKLLGLDGKKSWLFPFDNLFLSGFEWVK
jgi:hypothetical protein